MAVFINTTTWYTITNAGQADWTLVSQGSHPSNDSTLGWVYVAPNSTNATLTTNKWQIFKSTNQSYNLRTEACGSSSFLVNANEVPAMGADLLDGTENWILDYQADDPGYTITNNDNGMTRWMYAYAEGLLGLSPRINVSNHAFYWSIQAAATIADSGFATIPTASATSSGTISSTSSSSSVSATTTTTPSLEGPEPPHGGILGTGAQAGFGILIAVVAIAFLVLIWYLIRRRKRNRDRARMSNPNSDSQQPMQSTHSPIPHSATELSSNNGYTEHYAPHYGPNYTDSGYLPPNTTSHIYEADATSQPRELEAVEKPTHLDSKPLPQEKPS